MMVRRVLLALFVTVALGLTGPLAAQAAQPASPPAGSSCSVSPQSVDELVELAFPSGTPAAVSATPVSVAAEADLPQGAPADAATAAAAEQVIQSWLVCLLAGDEPRAFALTTDDLDAVLLQQITSLTLGDTPDELRWLLKFDLAEPLITGSTAALMTLGRDVRVLDDGRVGGIWATVGGDAAFFILEQQGASWLIDEIIDITDQ